MGETETTPLGVPYLRAWHRFQADKRIGLRMLPEKGGMEASS